METEKEIKVKDIIYCDKKCEFFVSVNDNFYCINQEFKDKNVEGFNITLYDDGYGILRHERCRIKYPLKGKRWEWIVEHEDLYEGLEVLKRNLKDSKGNVLTKIILVEDENHCASGYKCPYLTDNGESIDRESICTENDGGGFIILKKDEEDTWRNLRSERCKVLYPFGE